MVTIKRKFKINILKSNNNSSSTKELGRLKVLKIEIELGSARNLNLVRFKLQDREIKLQVFKLSSIYLIG